MIRLEIEGHKIGLSFSHHKVEDDPRVQRRSVCQVFNCDNPEKCIELAVGEAECSTKDQFRRDVGRKLALKRAICQHEFGLAAGSCRKCGSGWTHLLELSPEARLQIWLGYFDSLASKYPQPKDLVSGEPTKVS